MIKPVIPCPIEYIFQTDIKTIYLWYFIEMDTVNSTTAYTNIDYIICDSTVKTEIIVNDKYWIFYSQKNKKSFWPDSPQWP